MFALSIVTQLKKPAMPRLPLEIIIEVLSRLPVKPLVQFKTVCKSWHHLISSNPEFSRLQLQQAKQDSNVHLHRLFLSADPFISLDIEAYCDADENLVTRLHNFPVVDREDDFEFVGSCNGLISAVFGPDSQITIWNPSTGQSRRLPAAPGSFPDDKMSYGFGYDLKLDDYKLVRIASSASCIEVQMEIFNLKANTWRTVHNLNCCVRLQGGSIVALNGVLHWLVGQENEGMMIISFDLAEEKFLDMIQVPDYVTENWGINPGTQLRILQDSLCMCSGSHTTNFEAWKAERYETKVCWTKLFSFSNDQLPGCKYWLNVLSVAKNGSILLNYEGLEILIYNPKEQTLRRFDVPNDWHYFEAITYIESLVSPNSVNGSVAAVYVQG
ncbi:F-box/kelch-repeat protein At3g06240-like [Mercurialis annua]|uniref:F-box/kelch-repeat protein At3g06240-like n=1 Tax=Mercurialis annua TaxID=3986 RepID=UPI002160915D|nr:F-box/kelch-repeat protein At3g06240-like [Mercurialis annua]XP_055961381.1 F-box/kelch-repeat protein At3g06240-like [Mercurialis annua]XP_055961382.1 F-box/kelch-repeat protein At3g06240-like [Mercurialis annua]